MHQTAIDSLSLWFTVEQNMIDNIFPKKMISEFAQASIVNKPEKVSVM